MMSVEKLNSIGCDEARSDQTGLDQKRQGPVHAKTFVGQKTFSSCCEYETNAEKNNAKAMLACRIRLWLGRTDKAR